MMILVIGGARSGKSRFAQRHARALSATPTYVATSRRWDDDHAARIARHQADRGPEWRTVEEERAIDELGLGDVVGVVDCLTLWLTNVFLAVDQDVDRAVAECSARLERLAAQEGTWLLVSNELGQGVHAETAIGRRFVDAQGFLNQRAAALSDSVVWMVAGIPVCVKGRVPGVAGLSPTSGE